jgi:pimeloyl-ACP methyl ester carboxylesterase
LIVNNLYQSASILQTRSGGRFFLKKMAKSKKKKPAMEAMRAKARRFGALLNGLSFIAPRWAGRWAFRVFCTPRSPAISSRDQAFLAESQQYSFEYEGLSIQTYTWLPALPDPLGRVLFVHGWESNALRWRKYVKLFCEAGWEVTALDAPAHGHSEGRQINLPLYGQVLATHLGQVPPYNAVVGHSLGGGAVAMSLTLPDVRLPRTAILLGCFAESSRVFRDFGHFLGLNARVLQAAHAEIERLSGWPIEHYSVVRMVTQLRHLRGLVIHDRDDTVVPLAEGRLIADAWGVPLLQTEGLGHRMQHKSVVQRVFEFVTAG